MLDALVNRQDREITGAAQPAMSHDALQVAQHAVIAVGDGIKPVHHVRPGKMQAFLGDFRVVEVKQRLGFVAEQLCD